VKRSKDDIVKQLTWVIFRSELGTSSLPVGGSYQHSHRILELARTLEGGLVAWVKGTETSATLVDIDGRN